MYYYNLILMKYNVSPSVCYCYCPFLFFALSLRKEREKRKRKESTKGDTLWFIVILLNHIFYMMSKVSGASSIYDDPIIIKLKYNELKAHLFFFASHLESKGVREREREYGREGERENEREKEVKRDKERDRECERECER